jgi:hypothetical protein
MGQRDRPPRQRIPRSTHPPADDVRNQARAIELFQLAFMQAASAKLRPQDYAMKGGGNLRFFLRSGRRSGDVDLDYLGSNFTAFGERVNELLTGDAIPRLLKLRDIRVFDTSVRKDTPTTKRWMLKLARDGMPDATTKVEFSRRGEAAEPVLEQADTALARKLGGIAVRLNHYPPSSAIVQKVDALCDRSETEPRDVFDLDHLFRQYPDAVGQARLDPARGQRAAKVAEDIDYDRYQELVAPYLDEEIVELYGNEEAWLDMRVRVVTLLRERAKVSPR